MKIAVADLRPNPFRNIDHYPLKLETIAGLMESIKSTTFWDNLLARPAPDGDGFELAYGHHRWQALKKLEVEEIDIPVRDLDNATMAQIMARENMEEWGHNASVEQATVRAIIEAYGRGEIKLPSPNSKGRLNQTRYAPSFKLDVTRTSGAHPYTIPTLCQFLGWKQYKVEAAVGALELIERNIAEPENFAGLSTRQSQAVLRNQARSWRGTAARPEDAAKRVLRGLAAGMRHADGTGAKMMRATRITVRTAGARPMKYSAIISAKAHAKKKQTPNIEVRVGSQRTLRSDVGRS
jgi:ParB family chromosome partitioning protein